MPDKINIRLSMSSDGRVVTAWPIRGIAAFVETLARALEDVETLSDVSWQFVGAMPSADILTVAPDGQAQLGEPDPVFVIAWQRRQKSGQHEEEGSDGATEKAPADAPTTEAEGFRRAAAIIRRAGYGADLPPEYGEEEGRKIPLGGEGPGRIVDDAGRPLTFKRGKLDIPIPPIIQDEDGDPIQEEGRRFPSPPVRLKAEHGEDDETESQEFDITVGPGEVARVDFGHDGQHVTRFPLYPPRITDEDAVHTEDLTDRPLDLGDPTGLAGETFGPPSETKDAQDETAGPPDETARPSEEASSSGRSENTTDDPGGAQGTTAGD